MAPATRILLFLILASSIAIMPVLASRELVQNAQQKAKVVGNENIHTNTAGAKRMLGYSPDPGGYGDPPACATTCSPGKP